MNPDDSFADLMPRARSGDREAQTEVHQRFERRLLALAWKNLSSSVRQREGPEDVVQSVFKSFFARDASGQFQLHGWDELWQLLVRIAVRKCAKRGRAHSAERRDIRREASAPANDNGWEPYARDPTPQDA